MRRARQLLALLGLGAALCVFGCEKLLGIQPVHVDRASTGSGGADSGPVCSPVTELCADCARCDEIVEVTLNDFGPPTSPPLPLTGSTSGMSHSTVEPGVECTQAQGPERIYAVRIGKDGYLTATLPRAATTFDSVLYARKSCCAKADPSARCNDSRKASSDHSFHGGEVLSFRVAKGDVWYLFVDGSDDERGAFTLDLDLSPGVACAGQGYVPIAIEPGTPMTLSGNTMALGNQGQNRCFLNHPQGAGPLGEIVYELRAPKEVTAFDLALNGTFDAALYARSDCVDSNAGSPGEIVCKNENNGPGGEFITNLANSGGPIYVFVDTGALPAESFEYTLIVTPK